MTIPSVKESIEEEFKVIFGPEFSVSSSPTDLVPRSDDGGITFPNLDTKSIRCKVIETCVLYIDIRRSTELSLKHRPATVAKLYSAFVRAMTYCAEERGGHVRGIIGDRVMVLFNPSTCFVDAVDTAVLMNSVAKFLLNDYFTANEIECGIGIDFGRMLVTKTGIRRNGTERHNYRSLVWLGRPANVASKLTDAANKEHSVSRIVRVARQGVSLMFGLRRDTVADWDWRDESLETFVESLETDGWRLGDSPRLRYKDHHFRSFRLDDGRGIRTPAILMTKVVRDGYRKAAPNAQDVDWYRRVEVQVPGYEGDTCGGDVYFSVFK